MFIILDPFIVLQNYYYYFFDIDVEDIHYTSLYFFCKRCLEENPEDRVFLFV